MNPAIQITYFIQPGDMGGFVATWNLKDKMVGRGTTRESAIEDLHSQWDFINKHTSAIARNVVEKHTEIQIKEYIFEKVDEK